MVATALQLHTRDLDHRLEMDLHGELDLATGPHLIAVVDAALANRRISAVRLRPSHLRFVDVRGLSAVITARHLAVRSGRSFTIANSRGPLLRLARLTGTEDLLGVEASGAHWPGTHRAEAVREGHDTDDREERHIANGEHTRRSATSTTTSSACCAIRSRRPTSSKGPPTMPARAATTSLLASSGRSKTTATADAASHAAPRFSHPRHDR